MIMPTTISARRSAGVLVIATVVLVDQVTKVIATHDPSRVVSPVRNPAFALGIIRGPAPALILGSVLVLGAFLAIVDEWAARLGLSALMPALVAGGVVSNLLDRVRFGAARDFLVTPWAIINLADVAVVVGIIGILVALAANAPRYHARLSTSAHG